MRLPKNATAEFLHLSPLRVCSVACVLSGWWGSSGVLFRVDWELDAVSVGSGCSSSHYGQMPLSPSMGIWRATAATRHQTVRVPLPPEEEKWGREGQGGGGVSRTFSDVGGDGERGARREWREGGCRYFDAKVIRHAWHYSQPGDGGRER